MDSAPLCRQSNRHEAIRMLVTELGADIEAFSFSDGIPLSLAVSSGRPDLATVRLLGVELGANGAARLQDGKTSLHVAAREGNCDTVRVLVEEMGVAVNSQCDSGSTPLHNATGWGSSSTSLLGIAPPKQCGCWSRSSAPKSTPEATKAIPRNTPLHLAAGDERCETMRMLVKFGAHVNARGARGRTPLHRAAQCGNCAAMRVLVKELGADINGAVSLEVHEPTPLRVAAECNCDRSIRVLVRELGARGSMRLWAASQCYPISREAIRALVTELGADIEAVTKNGRTPLCQAVLDSLGGDTVRLLVEPYYPGGHQWRDCR